MNTAAEPLLSVTDLTVRFGNVVALGGATMHANEGEVTAIIGDNGAGKSSLMKAILGVYSSSEGTITIEGRDVAMTSPQVAKGLGIEAVFQDLALFDDLTLWQNMFINREVKRGWGPFALTKRAEMIARSDEMIRRLTVNVPEARRTVRSMSGGQRQAVAIARAVAWGSKLVIMDEPTAALGVRERTEVEQTIIQLRDEGRSFILVSHSFDQVMRVADAVWVMRHGKAVAHRRIKETTGEELVGLVTGAIES